MRAHGGEVMADRVRAGVAQPVSEERAVVICGWRTARLELEHDASFRGRHFGQRPAESIFDQQQRWFSSGGVGKVQGAANLHAGLRSEEHTFELQSLAYLV